MLKRMVFRILMVAGVVGAAMAMSPAPAQAGGHGHTSVAFGFNFGVPCCAYRPYYAPAYYYPPPAYYYPPPVVYAPPPYYAPAPVSYAPATATVSNNCRDYHGDATVDGHGTPFYGRACLGGDGRWHIVN